MCIRDRRSIEFGERRASDVMTPRTRVDFVRGDETVADVVGHVRATGHARFPVLDPETDRLLGIVATPHVLRTPAAERAATPVAAVMTDAVPVSYTHLDVYKRQRRGRPSPNAPEMTPSWPTCLQAELCTRR